MANLTGVIALAAAALYGGWEWALVCLIVLVALWRFESGVLPVLATVGVSFFWLALFHWTGDRRLFFPYSMQFAVQMACLLRGRMAKPAIVGGGSIVLVFTVIRISQSATAAVLIVELAVAGTALALAFALALHAYGRGSREASVRVIAGALGSGLAFAGLAI